MIQKYPMIAYLRISFLWFEQDCKTPVVKNSFSNKFIIDIPVRNP